MPSPADRCSVCDKPITSGQGVLFMDGMAHLECATPRTRRPRPPEPTDPPTPEPSGLAGPEGDRSKSPETEDRT
jgi:hypothetical protein